VDAAAVAVQMTHRTIAVLLLLHLIGVVAMLRRRRAEEAPIVVRIAAIALGMVVLQLVLASTMILLTLPAVLRSLHEATGIGVWLSCFLLAYLSRRTAPAAAGVPVDAVRSFSGRIPPVPATEQ
jgi:heme A synthase